jgi:hypothetical protein
MERRMKSRFKCVVSNLDGEGNPLSLPVTVSINFRVFERAKQFMRRAIKAGQYGCIVELCKEGTIATWEYDKEGRLAFDCNDELAEKYSSGWVSA